MSGKTDEATRKLVSAGRTLLAYKPLTYAVVGVARQTMYTWKARLDEGDIDALRNVKDSVSRCLVVCKAQIIDFRCTAVPVGETVGLVDGFTLRNMHEEPPEAIGSDFALRYIRLLSSC